MSEENQSPYNVDKEAFEREGLIDVAPYLWRFDSVTPGEKDLYDDNGEPTGETYPVINIRLAAVERAIYDTQGNFDGIEELDPELTRTETFKLHGTGAKKLRTAYRAVTGRPLSGTPYMETDEKTGKEVKRFRIDLLAAAEELLGGAAWNNIFHTESTDEFPSRDLLTNTFRKAPPKKVRVNRDDED